MTDQALEEKIYLTYKTRMTTEARLRRAGVIAYILLSWFSTALIIFSLMDLSEKFSILNFSIISASVSIVILAASMFIYGERYNERAEQFKGCYLKLKALYESEIATDIKMRKYAEILEAYENQSDDDYDEMVFDAWLRGQSISNARGIITISWVTIINVVIKRLTKFIGLCALFLMPVVFYGLWVTPL